MNRIRHHADRKIAYILKGFPRLSESFIANEVRLLTGHGLNLYPFSIKAGDALAERDGLPSVCYLPEVTTMSGTSLWCWLGKNFGDFSSTQKYWVLRSPLRYTRTLVFAIACAWKYRAGTRFKKTFIKEFLFATIIARRMRVEGGFAHIHAHFCHDATTVAWMVSMLVGLPFSFTAHAKDIYQNKLNPGNFLERKLAATKFATTCTLANVKYLAKRTSNSGKIHGIYHGLDTNRFRPNRHRLQRETQQAPITVARLLSIGRHVEKKGFAYLLDACRLLRDRGLRFQLDIFGEKGDQTERMVADIGRFNLHEYVFLKAPVPQNKLTDIYHSADLFVLPCIVVDDGDRDGIPNVMAEAMACGLPVVVSDVSGIPEIVEHEVTGLLVPQKDSQALAVAIERLLSCPSLRQCLSLASRHTIECRFDANTTHKVLRDIFLRTLDESNAVL